MVSKEQDIVTSNAVTSRGAMLLKHASGNAGNDTDTMEGIIRLLEIGQRQWYKSIHQHGNESVYSSRII